MSDYYIYNGELYSPEDLAHYGVKGQKWGVRRAQKKAQRKANRDEYARYTTLKRDLDEAERIGLKNARYTNKGKGYTRNYAKAKPIFEKHGVKNIDGLDKLYKESYTDAVKKYEKQIAFGTAMMIPIMTAIGSTAAVLYDSR